MDENLKELGLEPVELSPQQCRQIDEQGFLILENVICADWLIGLRQAFERVFAREGEAAGVEVAQMEGVRRLADLVNKGEVFDDVYLQPELLAVVGHVLRRPFKLHSLNAHDPLPGHGQQILHADWGGERQSQSYHVVNSMWMLDDVTADNGATRIVPGSQRDQAVLTEIMADRLAPHPQERLLVAPAGSVCVFNGSAWHSCTVNESQSKRRVLHCAFIAREHEQQTDQRTYLQPDTEARLNPLARYILDVDWELASR